MQISRSGGRFPDLLSFGACLGASNGTPAGLISRCQNRRFRDLNRTKVDIASIKPQVKRQFVSVFAFTTPEMTPFQDESMERPAEAGLRLLAGYRHLIAFHRHVISIRLVLINP